MHFAVDPANPAREGGGSIASKGPESAAGGNVAATACDDSREECHDEQSKCSASAAGGLVVNLGEGEAIDAGDDLLKVVDGVEESDHIQDTSDKSNAHLSQDGLGDVPAGSIDIR